MVSASSEGFLKLQQFGLEIFILVSRELRPVETYSNAHLIILLCSIV